MSATAASTTTASKYVPKILVITTNACSYPGVDNAGQQHLEYPPNSFVIRVPSPVLFPEDFYLRTFRKGVDGIIIMSCGEECPYSGAFKRLSLRINKVMKQLKNEYGLEPQRLKLTAICTVCAKHVVKEITEMDKYLRKLEPAREILSRAPASSSDKPQEQ
ncbi:MAG: hydrogenase iron-sulfur subunit [Candidatus Hodarchaeales archaeon]